MRFFPISVSSMFLTSQFTCVGVVDILLCFLLWRSAHKSNDYFVSRRPLVPPRIIINGPGSADDLDKNSVIPNKNLSSRAKQNDFLRIILESRQRCRHLPAEQRSACGNSYQVTASAVLHTLFSLKGSSRAYAPRIAAPACEEYKLQNIRK